MGSVKNEVTEKTKYRKALLKKENKRSKSDIKSQGKGKERWKIRKGTE